MIGKFYTRQSLKRPPGSDVWGGEVVTCSPRHQSLNMSFWISLQSVRDWSAYWNCWLWPWDKRAPANNQLINNSLSLNSASSYIIFFLKNKTILLKNGGEGGTKIGISNLIYTPVCWPFDPALMARERLLSLEVVSGKLVVRYSIMWSTGSRLNTRNDELSPSNIL